MIQYMVLAWYIFSLIYKLFVLFNTHLGKWHKASFFNDVNLAVELFA